MQDLKLERLYRDPTLNHVVAQRLGLELTRKLEWSTLSHEERKQLHDIVRKVSLRLIAAWKAVAEYANLTHKMVEQSRLQPRSGKEGACPIEPSQELYEHLDAFLTQFKSCLDYLVKAGGPVFGVRKWTLRTFAKKGKGVISALSNLPAEFQTASAELSQFISMNEGWLGEAISFRDRMNHGIDGGVDPSLFTIHSEKVPGGINTYCPLFKNVPLEEYLAQMWWNLFQFVEGFAAYLVWARAKPGFRLYFTRVAPDSQHSPWALFPEGLLEQSGHPARCIGRDDESP